MATCDNCGNDYDHMLEVQQDGETYQFDCFECAIQTMAPRCDNCETRIIGHGMSTGNDTFCCASCARAQGYEGFVDRL